MLELIFVVGVNKGYIILIHGGLQAALFLFLFWATAPSGPGRPHSRDF